MARRTPDRRVIRDGCSRPTLPPRLRAALGRAYTDPDLASGSPKVSGDRPISASSLDQIDRRLTGYRNEAGAVRRLLRSHAALAPDARRAMDNVFRLRNEMCAFLLHWRTQQLLPASHPAAIDAQRQVDTTRLQGSRTARDLTVELDRLAPEMDRLASDWIRATADPARFPDLSFETPGHARS